MRTPRIAILVLFLTSSLFLFARALSYSHRSPKSSSSPHLAPVKSSTTSQKSSVWDFVFYNTPFSLFPPNAAISLTDDNSTSFAARPAAFGPKLAKHGLSGELWVGSGFVQDSVDGEGELGCSDLPGWDDGNLRNVVKNIKASTVSKVAIPAAKMRRPRGGNREMLLDGHELKDTSKSSVVGAVHTINDGTDDYLHEGLSSPIRHHESSVSSSHADIKSIQEAAEISGKIVLLTRGGCGFLEKVMWAQRRGAVAVIVGDNQRGGPLIQMFAHGDEVDNVTIPSVFTARTTAHLLSSLTQPGSYIEDFLDDNGNSVLRVQQAAKPHRNNRKLYAGKSESVAGLSLPTKKRSWLSAIFGNRRAPNSKITTRPPTSGRLENFKDSGKTSSTATSSHDFVIGVQDWRDPSLVDKHHDESESQRSNLNNSKKATQSKGKSGTSTAASTAAKGAIDPNGPQGGSITPSSGEYNHAGPITKDHEDAASASTAENQQQDDGFVSKLFSSHSQNSETEKTAEATTMPLNHDGHHDSTIPHEPHHQGLWITITPTSSTSPFFDTLLVLVISPLVTLTIVYSMLIVRARLRRRRWRAPKSVVERLPVRTFHAIAVSSQSSRLPSPSSSSPTTPLLQQAPAALPELHNQAGPSSSSSVPVGTTQTLAAAAKARGVNEREKGAGGFSAEWKKYMGRQVECVVCLEEYVDGVSRVMSLPCGHEFHEDCITPWLTTRRRTCPICKGDVVRSLARGAYSSSSSPRYEPYRDDSSGSSGNDEAEGSGSLMSDNYDGDDDDDDDDDDEQQGGEEEDLERGASSSERHGRGRRGESWLSILTRGFRTRTGSSPLFNHQSQDRDG